MIWFRLFLFSKDSKLLASNSGWLVGEKVFTGMLTILVAAVVARYLGPEKYGLLSYTFAVAGLFAVLGELGLDGLVVRELVAKPKQQPSILGTVTGLKFLSYGTVSLVLAAFGFWTSGGSKVEQLLFAFAAIFVILQSLSAPLFWFHSRVEGRYVSISNTAGSVASNGFRILLVTGGASLLWFGSAYILTAVVMLTFAFGLFKFRGGPPLRSWHFDLKIALSLLRESGLIFVGSISAVIFLKIDQVMLRWMMGIDVVGTYAVASQLSEAFYIIPTAIAASVFPRLIALKSSGKEDFERGLQSILNINSLISQTIVILILIFSGIIISILFGSQYYDSIIILQIHILAAPFIFSRICISRWVLIEKKYKLYTVYQLLGALLNILLNYFMIPHLGAKGAAIATVISYCFAGYIGMVLHKETRGVFRMATTSFLFPWMLLFRPMRTWSSLKSSLKK